MKNYFFWWMMVPGMWSVAVCAQPGGRLLNLPQAALSAYCNGQQDLYAFASNQAVLYRQPQAGLALLIERKFLLEQNSSAAIAAVMPTPLGNIGILFSQERVNAFQENAFGLAYSRNMGKFSLGLQFNGYLQSFKGYGSTLSYNASIAGHFSIGENVQTGIQLHNPVAMFFSKQKAASKPYSLQWGFGYTAAKQFFLGANLVKEENQPVTVLANLQYTFAKKFIARLGINTATGNLFTAAGWSWKNMQLDLTVSHHPQLGLSPGIIISFKFKKEQK